MINGEDSELGAARKTMDVSITRLQQATEYAILGNTEKIQSMNTDLQQNQELQTRIMESQTKMLETVIESQQEVRNDLMNIQKLLVMYEEKRREEPKQRSNKSANQKKPPTANRVRNYFIDMPDPAREYNNIKDTLVADTCLWPFQESEWTAWISQDDSESSRRCLTISGLAGTGKSHIAVSAYDHLKKLAEQDSSGSFCVANFYFREYRDGLSTLR